ncbi:MAG: NADP-dependent oxidoreductase [Chloroflexota bacterium]
MTMIAARIHQYGDSSALKLDQIPIPRPHAYGVQVRVAAVSVNPVDWKICRGALAPLLHSPFPITLGYDVSGTVTAVGDAVTNFQVGDEVYGMVNFPFPAGGYAEYVVTQPAQLAKKSASLSHVESAALPLVTLTAWQALFDTAQLSAGQRVLIHAASGGVGHIAVQLAKWKGAHVIGTASAANEQYLHELGVDTFINYRESEFDAVLQNDPVDVVLGTIPGETLHRSFKIVKPNGTVASITEDPAEMAQELGIRGLRVTVRPKQSQLVEAARLADEGMLKPTIGGVYPLANIQEAHDMSQSGRVRGKLVLEVSRT